MKAIITKYHGPTNTKGARIHAKAEGCPGKWFWYGFNGTDHAHKEAAQAYRDERGWTGAMAGGGLPDQTGYAWVFVGDDGNYIPVRA